MPVMALLEAKSALLTRHKEFFNILDRLYDGHDHAAMQKQRGVVECAQDAPFTPAGLTKCTEAGALFGFPASHRSHALRSDRATTDALVAKGADREAALVAISIGHAGCAIEQIALVHEDPLAPKRPFLNDCPFRSQRPKRT